MGNLEIAFPAADLGAGGKGGGLEVQFKGLS